MAKKNKKPGRKPAEDPAIFRYHFNLNSIENTEFIRLHLKSGIKERTKFIKAVIFQNEVRVIKTDRETSDYFNQLTQFYTQYKAIGNNYNQVVKAIKTNFDEKRGRALLTQLEKATIQLITITKQLISLTLEYEQKWLQ